MAGGFRSAFPLLGVSAPPVSTQGGYRSHLWRWGGGATAPAPPPLRGGYRSLLAIWTGGAFAGRTVPPTPRPSKGGIPDTWKREHDEDDEELMMLVGVAMAAYWNEKAAPV